MNNIWIAGAGFSASLGGPLLESLFSPHSLHRVRTEYPKEEYKPLHTPEIAVTHWLYQWGRDFSGGSYPWNIHNPPWYINKTSPGEGIHIWRNAEEFLEYLGLAQTPAGAQWAGIIARAFDQASIPPVVLYKEARRLLAAECMLFTEHAPLESERWAPYVRWVQHLLQPGDLVLSFNYDPVMQILADKHPDKLQVLSPTSANLLRGAIAKSSTASCLQLHGSTNWVLNSDGGVDTDTTKAILRSDVEPCLGIPGPGKFTLTSGALAGSWEIATEAFARCAGVYLLGYRFPPTDSEARRRIIEAIGKRPNEGNRHVRVVLGQPSADSQRVKTMVGLVAGHTAEVEVLPVYVEDLFTVLPPKHCI